MKGGGPELLLAAAAEAEDWATAQRENFPPSGKDPSGQPPFRTIVAGCALPLSLSSYALLSFLDQSHQVLFPLFTSTSPSRSGSSPYSNRGLRFSLYINGLTLSSFELLNVL